MLIDLGYGPLKGVDYKDGKSGKNGRSVELRNDGYHIQWKYTDEDTWVNLLDIESIKGRDGRDGQNGESARIDTELLRKLHTQKPIKPVSTIIVDGGRADEIFIEGLIIGGGGAEV